MRNSDNNRTPTDAPFRAPGAGALATFRCGACTKFRLMTGRKLRRCLGLRQYVCGPCASVMDRGRLA